MVRATTRSQRQPKPSQSQPRRSQRGNALDEEEEQEEDEHDEEEDNAMDVDEEGGNDAEEDIKRKAAHLVRLALFSEHKRTPIKRDEITKKVLGSNTRSFNRVFELAQKTLHNTFGMELVELRSRAALGKDVAGEDEGDDARKTTGLKKKATAAGSKTYILRSKLDPIIIDHAALTDPDILEEEAADQGSDDEDESGQCYGSILSWSTSDQLGALGILHVVLSLILVSGRVMTDAELRGQLKRLRLPGSGMVDFSAQSTHRTLTADQHLSNLMRQGYLDQNAVGDHKKGKGGAAKRARATQADNEDSGETYEWRWGNRAFSEIGEEGIARFIAEFMAGEADDEGNQTAKAVDKMYKGVEKAAGGSLMELL